MPMPGDYVKAAALRAEERKIEGELMAGLAKWAKKDPARRVPMLKRMAAKRGEVWAERLRAAWRADVQKKPAEPA